MFATLGENVAEDGQRRCGTEASRAIVGSAPARSGGLHAMRSEGTSKRGGARQDGGLRLLRPARSARQRLRRALTWIKGREAGLIAGEAILPISNCRLKADSW
jgi:hypothetical protein